MLGPKKHLVEEFSESKKSEYYQACRDKKAYLIGQLCSNYTSLPERTPLKKMMVHFNQVY